MPTVRVEPAGIVLSLAQGESVLEAAERLGFSWPTLCHGDCCCSVCWMEVIQGCERIPQPDDDEQETLELLPQSARPNGTVRLACRARPEGDIVVEKRGVRFESEYGIEAQM